MEGKRTHDAFYLKENYKSNPKEYFKLTAKNIEIDLSAKKGNFSIMDVGCETGSFLHYIHSCFPKAQLYGIDVMKELLDEVNKPVDIGIKAHLADISSTSFKSDMKYDAVTMLGVLGIFDDFEPVIDNLVEMTAEGGRTYIFGIFNPEKLDVVLRSRPAGTHDEWEKGWNVFAEESIAQYCDKKNLKHEFVEFNMPFAIERHEGDPLRSWTVDMGDRFMVVNGLQLIHNFRLLKIWR